MQFYPRSLADSRNPAAVRQTVDENRGPLTCRKGEKYPSGFMLTVLDDQDWL